LIDILRDRVGTDVISTILSSGYGFDFFDDEVLMKMIGRSEPERLVLGSSRYRVIILPGVERIPLETMDRLLRLARSGVTVIATRRIPDVVPGLNATPADQNQLHNMTKGLFSGVVGRAFFVEDEKEMLGQKLVGALPPDLSLNPAVPDIGFVHRRTNDADIYFVANTSNISQAVKATFRVAQAQPEFWDPFSGKVTPAKIENSSPAGTTIALDLEPYASRVVIFSKRKLGSPASTAVAQTPAPIDLSNDWNVTIGETKPIVMDHLRSWTEDESTRYFSGTATYEKEVTVPGEFLKSGVAVRLDFGEGKPLPEQNLRSGMQTWLDAPIREAAVIYINEQRAGSIWCPPYALDVSALLRPGANKIRIVVANLALNYMAGRRLPDYRLLNLRYGERFQAQDMDKVQPIASGLLGPVRLVAQSR
jgi:hypothetical protein